MNQSKIKGLLKNELLRIQDFLHSENPVVEEEQYGVISSIKNGIVEVYGLTNMKLYDLVCFDNIHDLGSLNPSLGVIIHASIYRVTIVPYDPIENLTHSTTVVKPLRRSLSIAPEENIINMTLDGFGRVNRKNIFSSSKKHRYNLLTSPSSWLDIQVPKKQLITGISAIDVLTPIAFGQRQAILGDYGTGKSSIAKSIMINQKNNENVLSIYVSMMQSINNVTDIKNILDKNNCHNNVIINANSSDSAIERFLAPYTALAVAKYFRDVHSKDVIIIFEDFTKHAESYREISILSGQKMGRDTYPGDIFAIHAHLLSEGYVSKNGGSITLLPMIETFDNNIQSYLATNVMSITDGQIILDEKMSQKSIFPAISSNLSVSRIGRDICIPLFKTLSSEFSNRFRRENANRNFFGEDSKSLIIMQDILTQIGMNPRGLLYQVFILYMFIKYEKNVTNIKEEEIILYESEFQKCKHDNKKLEELIIRIIKEREV